MMLKSGGGFSNRFWFCLAICAGACAGDRTTFEDEGKKTDDSVKVDGGPASDDSGPQLSDPSGTTGTSASSDSDPTTSDPDPTSSDPDPTTDPTTDTSTSTTEPAVDCEPGDSRSCAEGGLLGNCAAGEQTCDEDGKFGSCSVVPASADKCTPDDDADCDGKANEECGCMDGDERACSADGFKGACAEGVEACADGAWGDCSIEPENADDCSEPGNDADCDGTPNSGCACTEDQACGPEAVGICQPGVSACVDGAYAECEGAVEAEARDCSSSEDNDCDGEPDDTLDDECECEPGMEQDCDEHAGKDGKGECTAGKQTCELGADGTTSAWGDCVGAVGPAGADTCVPGNDNDCDGMENEGCTCTAQADCNDNKTCTTDACADGECTNMVNSGFCLIAGQCVADDQPDPTNPCRICDASANPTGWTNAGSDTSCDDELWCNGEDTCNAGTCTHEFPSNNRCAGSTGACETTTCDENNKSCLQPSSYICQVETVKGCLDDACGSDVMTWKVDHYCKGDRADCTGGMAVPHENQATLSKECVDAQFCNSATNDCKQVVDCSANVYCDPVGDLCWMNEESFEFFTQPEAKAYCEGLDFAGTTAWTQPTDAQARTIIRGCDDGFCQSSEGPGIDGCYWPTEMGPCPYNLWLDNTMSAYWVVENALIGTAFGDYPVRCVTPYVPH